MTSIVDSGIWKCGWLSNIFAASSGDSASTIEYIMMSFFASEVPLAFTSYSFDENEGGAVVGLDSVLRHFDCILLF